MLTSSTDSAQPDDYAVIIGIDCYPLMPGADLENARRDALAFKAWLILDGVPEGNISTVLTTVDSHDPLPQKREIDEAYELVFRLAKAKHGEGRVPRRLYVYYAGHGTSQGQRHVALLTAGISVDYMNRSLNTSEYHDGLSTRALFPEQILFYDCCRNYDWRVPGEGPEWTRGELEGDVASVEQWVYYAAGFTELQPDRNQISPDRPPDRCNQRLGRPNAHTDSLYGRRHA